MDTDAGPARQFDPYLRPGETVLWAGQPNPNRWVSTFDPVLIPFSLVWCGGSVFILGALIGWWEGATPGQEGEVGLFALLFPVFGLYLVFGRFLHKSYKKKRTFYAVTDQRVLYLALRRWGDRLFDIALDDVKQITGEETVVGGCGSLTCYRRRGVNGALSPWYWHRDLVCAWGDPHAVLLYDVDHALELKEWIWRLRSVPQADRSGMTFPPRR